MLTNWIKNKESYDKILLASNKSIVITRRIGNCGRNALHQDLDNKLYDWVVFMNNKGLIVKDIYLKLKALAYSEELKISSFVCSTGYIDEFKNRYGLVSRVQTTCRLLPQNTKFLAIEFIESTKKIIENYNIKSKNIFNFDNFRVILSRKTNVH
ncbi:Major centromere autoantigen B [Dictyocoela muelleri]|nr:Major centromere autoantigen B [Dictyocoela muelleri]